MISALSYAESVLIAHVRAERALANRDHDAQDSCT
jgi:hypothetical protein